MFDKIQKTSFYTLFQCYVNFKKVREKKDYHLSFRIFAKIGYINIQHEVKGQKMQNNKGT